jgi:pyruvate dehydrogenase E2 component (dihydrolipoamide acetyltransferase)
MADDSALPSRGEVTIVELSRRERTIARRSAESRAIVPSAELWAEADMAAALEQERLLQCGTTALLVKACARALHEVPRANGAYRDGRIELYSRINIGVAVMDGGAYEIPTVLDADRKTAQEIGLELAGFAQRARDGLLSAPELAGATFTVADSLGSDVAARSPLIVPPQAAALAAGPVRDAPVIRDGAVVAGKTSLLTLAADHRILYGSYSELFLGAITRHLENATP